MINSKNLDPNKIKIKDLKYVTINSVNPLYLAINKINRYIEKINENNYLTIDPADESKDTPNLYLEKQRISQGVTSVLSIFICQHTCDQAVLVGRIYLSVRVCYAILYYPSACFEPLFQIVSFVISYLFYPLGHITF